MPIFGSRPQQDAEPAPYRLLLGPGLLARMVRVGLVVCGFSVITGSILADTTTERGTGASKVAWFLSPTDRDAMRRTAAAALTNDIATGSVKLDPCNASPKKK